MNDELEVEVEVPLKVVDNSPITRTFILHGHILATQTITRQQLEGDLAFDSLAYFCPKCGEIWSRVEYSNHKENWQCLPRYCDKHVGDYWEDAMAGCFSYSRYAYPIRLYPPEVIRHDFKMIALHQQRIRDETAQNP
jgi:hypothetical protein